LKLPTFSKTNNSPKVIKQVKFSFMCLFIKNEKVLKSQKKNSTAGRSILTGNLFEKICMMSQVSRVVKISKKT